MIRKATNIKKMKTVVRVLGIRKKVRDEKQVEEREEGGGDTVGTLRRDESPGGKGKEKMSQSPRFRESRRIKLEKGVGLIPKEGRERARLDARKHENLVDQLKLRKKTHIHDEISAKVMKLSRRHKDQFEESKILGCVKVWHPTR